MIEPSQRRNLFVYLGLAVVIAVVYSPVCRFGFVSYDDSLYITENPHLPGGLTLRGLGWAFTTGLDQWMPVTWLVRILEYQLFGLNAGAHHLVNVVFHLVNAVVLFSVLNRMTGAPWRSAFVAALFALHPLHVESVAWVTGLKDVLSLCFFMLTIWAYVRYVEQPNRRRYLLTVGLYVLAMMSKPMVVTLPFVLLLLDYWPLGRTRWAKPAVGEGVKAPPSQLLREKLPFLALAAALCGATLWAQRTGGIVASLERLPLGQRITNALVSYVGYLGKAFWPPRLAVFYPLDTNSSSAAAMVAGVGLGVVTAAVIWRAGREPWLATGWFWYLGTLVPVIGLVQVGIQSMADRYTYIPLVGLFMMLCWSVPYRVMKRPVSRMAVSVAAVAVLVVCATLARIQVDCWKNTETLFRHALNVTRDNWLAHNNLGVALGQAGRIQEEIGHYEEALRLKPNYADAHYNLGAALLESGNPQEAIRHWELALRIAPNYPDADNNLGLAFYRLGKLDEAIGHYGQALRIKPDNAAAHYNLGVALEQAGKGPEAIGHFRRALEIKPDYAEAYNDLGTALWRAGRIQEACECYEQAVRLKPGFAAAHYNLGGALEQAGQLKEAIAQYREALRLKPDMAEAQDRLARLRAAQ